MIRPELICPAGTPAALRDAVDAGADAVYCGFQNATNARNFPGLNFTPAEMEKSVAYAHAKGAKVLLAVNTFPPAGKFDLWREAIDLGVKFGVDAFIVADIGNPTFNNATIQDRYQSRASNLASANNPYSEIHLFVNQNEPTCPPVNVTTYRDTAIAAATRRPFTPLTGSGLRWVPRLARRSMTSVSSRPLLVSVWLSR